jgi:hypothetical protein
MGFFRTIRWSPVLKQISIDQTNGGTLIVADTTGGV